MGRNSISPLIRLLESHDVLPLAGLADTTFLGLDVDWGHGRRIEYDLSRLSMRAAWVLESLTFRDFGFRTLDEKEQRLAIGRARLWWQYNDPMGWSRLAELERAIQGSNPYEQLLSLEHLAFGSPRFSDRRLADGAYFVVFIRTRVLNIANGDGINAKLAQHVLEVLKDETAVHDK